MRPTTVLFGLTLALTFVLAGCTSPGDEEEVNLVNMENTAFDPKEITIQAGETVTWKNLDSFAHTVTADDDSFDSDTMDRGDTFEWTFEEPGEYPYHCIPHSGEQNGNFTGMVGTVIVQAA